MIEFQNIFLQYHYEKYSLFEGLSFALADGVSTVLCDVQSGKTSLCKLILGQLAPNSGAVTVNGKNVCGRDCNLSALYLPASPAFFPNKSVLYNLQYPLKVRKIPPQQQQLHALAAQFDLDNVLQQKVKTLSASQQKRLARARGLVVCREVVLFDDFFDDTMSEGEIQDVLQLFDCKACVIVTSNPALAFGNTVVISDKRCLFQGEAEAARNVVSSLGWLAAGLKKISEI